MTVLPVPGLPLHLKKKSLMPTEYKTIKRAHMYKHFFFILQADAGDRKYLRRHRCSEKTSRLEKRPVASDALSLNSFCRMIHASNIHDALSLQ